MFKKTTYTNDSKRNEGNELEEDPRFVIFNVKQDRMFISKRIDWPQNESSNQGAEKRSPQSFQREVVTDLKEKHRNRGKFKLFLNKLFRTTKFCILAKKKYLNWKKTVWNFITEGCTITEGCQFFYSTVTEGCKLAHLKYLF